MTSFADLPNEIIDLILHRIHGRDFQNIAQVSSHIWRLAQSYLPEQRRLNRELASQSLPDFSTGGTCRLARAIIDNPYLGQYIRTLHIVIDCKRGWSEDGRPNRIQALHRPASNQNIFEYVHHLIQSRVNLRSEISQYDLELRVPLVLLYASNITTISVRVHGSADCKSNQSQMWFILAQIATAVSVPVLPRLKSVLLNGPALRPHHVKALSAIATVRRLRIGTLLVNTEATHTVASMSPIENLELIPDSMYYREVDARSLHLLLQSFNTTLTSIVVKWVELIRAYGESSLTTYASVLSPVCRNLRRLTILYTEAYKPWRKSSRPSSVIQSLGSLIHFTVLEYLETYLDDVIYMYPFECPLSLTTFKLHSESPYYHTKAQNNVSESARAFLSWRSTTDEAMGTLGKSGFRIL